MILHTVPKFLVKFYYFVEIESVFNTFSHLQRV